MLFGLFSRKQGSPSSFTFNHESHDSQTQTQTDSQPETPPSSTVIEPMQLRTPSPSVDSHSNLAGPSSPGSVIRGTIYRPMSPLQNSLSQLAVHSDSESQSSPEQQSQKLYRLIASIPAKTLHQYTLAKLRAATNPSTSSTSEHHPSHATLAAVADFFADLHPPPKLHCVRCHREYVEVENGDRSCTVAHDDESTIVERVGRGTRRGRGGEDGPEYETLWQCCGKTVEGDGNQGPPDGWCYEGKHTVNRQHTLVSDPVSLTLYSFQTDIKRARWREDSTPQDDKLVSCLRKNCNNIRSKLTSSPSVKPASSVSPLHRRATQRKRTHSIKEGDAEDHKPQSVDENAMEVDQDAASATGSVRGRSKRKADTGKTELRTRSTESRKLRSSSRVSTTTTRRAASVSAKPKSRLGRKSVTKDEEDLTVPGDDAAPKKRRKVA